MNAMDKWIDRQTGKCLMVAPHRAKNKKAQQD